MLTTPPNDRQSKEEIRESRPSSARDRDSEAEDSLNHQQHLRDDEADLEGATTEGRVEMTGYLKFLSRSSSGMSTTSPLEEPRVSQGVSSNMMPAPQSSMSPLHRLPPELLTEIFIHCLPRSQFVQPDGKEAPLLLMQVCTFWRRVCMSSPELWTSLELVTKISEARQLDEDRRHVTNTESLLGLWLSHSGDCPLSISIQNDSLLIKDAEKALDSYAPRLQHLKVTIPKKTHPSILSNKQYPLLESFELYTPCGLTDTLINDLSCAMMRSPMLHRFIWNNTSYLSSQINLPWSNLTHLQLTTTITLDQCLTILSMAINATYLHFKDIFPNSAVPPYSVITLPNLSSLILCSRFDIATLFERLTVPKLKVFMVTIPSSWPHSALIGLFLRSRFALQNLGIFFAPLTEVELVECLDLVQNTLTELTIQGKDTLPVTDALLDRFTVTGAGGVFCPRLESVAFYRCIACSPGRYAKMIRSRLKPAAGTSQAGVVAPFKGVEILQTEAELIALMPLRKLGLRLTVYSEEDGSTVDIDLDNGATPE